MAATRIFRSIGLNARFKDLKIPGITIVRTKDQAKAVLDILYRNPKKIHAWNAEAIVDDTKDQSPLNSRIICATAFIGPDVNFGTGSKLFIDNYAETNCIIEEFKEYFENPNYCIAWHDYGLHQRIFHNYEINILGLGGDTMEMAKLENPSRAAHEYSLAWCTEHYSPLMIKIKSKVIKELEESSFSLKAIQDYTKISKTRAVKNFEELISNQTRSPKRDKSSWIEKTPTIEELHETPEYIEKWLDYSTLNAELIFYLRELLISELSKISLASEGINTLWDFYFKHRLPKVETLADIEKNRVKLDLYDAKKIPLKWNRIPCNILYPKFEQIPHGCLWVPCKPNFNTNTYAPIWSLSILPRYNSFTEIQQNLNAKTKKIPYVLFKEEEDQMLRDLINQHGEKWFLIAKKLNETFHDSKPVRSGSTIRGAWISRLCSKSEAKWSWDEDIKLLKLKLKFGNQWKAITNEFRDRNERSIQTRWRSLFNKTKSWKQAGFEFDSVEMIIKKMIEKVEKEKLAAQTFNLKINT